PRLSAALSAKLAADRASEPPREVRFVQVFCDAASGLGLIAYGPPTPAVEDEGDVEKSLEDEGARAAGGALASSREGPAARATPLAAAPRPELEGVGHALHEVRTDTAT